jgi:hypothetical protein
LEEEFVGKNHFPAQAQPPAVTRPKSFGPMMLWPLLEGLGRVGGDTIRFVGEK